MKLRDLIPPDNLQAADGDIEITGITADSRAVKPDNLFVAVPGSKTDGLRFIPQAVAAGAAAVMAEQKPADIPLTIAFVEVPNVFRDSRGRSPP
jgi:UDP-N-acetylmuramoyl-L-alanyl-D-glutamate--2,6-diaminopimelate ligase